MSERPSEPNPGTPGTGQVGFGHSRRRILGELGIMAGAALLLVLGVFFLASRLADYVARHLPPDADVGLGSAAWEQVAPAAQRCPNDAPRRYVESLAKPLLEQANSSFTFQFTVVDNSEVNAFALPGGFITVNMGLLTTAESGEEVAAVLAHEIAHVTERHGTKRIVREAGTWVLLSFLFGGSDYQSLAHAGGQLVTNAYDRGQETEADEVGQTWLRAAGISPSAMADFFARLARAGGTLPTLLSTHPDPGDRSDRARAAAQGFVAKASLPSPKGLTCR